VVEVAPFEHKNLVGSPPAVTIRPLARENLPIPRLVAFAGAVVVIVIIVLVAFGSSSNSSVDPLAKAATLSGNAPGFRMTMTMKVGTASEPDLLTGAGSGVFDTRGHSGAMGLEMKIPTEAGTTEKLAINEVLNGQTIYMQLPAALEGALGVVGKKWISVNLSKVTGIPGLSSLSSNPASTNPGEMLQYLKAASGSVTNLGHQVVDGFSTTGYHANLQISKIPGAVPPSERAAAQAAMSKIQQLAHISAIPVSVWIDKHQLVRRMAISVTASADGQTIDEVITLDIPEYGPQSPPTIPPASEVAPASSLSPSSSSSSSSTAG
jgi:hypothetical protein